jgi:hypothetical protein
MVDVRRYLGHNHLAGPAPLPGHNEGNTDMYEWQTIYPAQLVEGLHRIRSQGGDWPGPLVLKVHNRESSWANPDVTVETIGGGRKTMARHLPIQVIEWDTTTSPYV